MKMPIFVYFRKVLGGILSLVMILCLSLSLPSLAQEKGRKSPILVEADHMQYDSENKINTYSGNVIAKQDTLTIKSASIEVRQDKAGYQLGLAKGSAKKRAFFVQERPQTFERIEGEAQRIEYDSRTATVRLVGDATLRRYKNKELWDQTSGGTISYNDNTSFFTVESGRNRESKTGRVTSIFTPGEN